MHALHLAVEGERPRRRGLRRCSVFYRAGRARACRGDSRDVRAATATLAADDELLGISRPEPEVDAPLRVLVLGDSYMQGMFIGDDETPPECLRRHLRGRLATRVSVLNTGVMGYSPEQYYYTLTAFVDRFRPHFVVVSVYANDFGNALSVVSRGVGDWPESKHWLEKIAHVCQARDCPFLVVSVPIRACILDRRTSGNYPGQLFNVLEIPSRSVLDPFDDFVAAYLATPAARAGTPKRLIDWCPLYNDNISDNDNVRDDHFSAAGAGLGTVRGRTSDPAPRKRPGHASRRRGNDNRVGLRSKKVAGAATDRKIDYLRGLNRDSSTMPADVMIARLRPSWPGPVPCKVQVAHPGRQRSPSRTPFARAPSIVTRSGDVRQFRVRTTCDLEKAR